MIILIDNYDSFVYNLYQYFKIIGEDIEVFRNDKITIKEIIKKNPKAIVISPGPCTPHEAGICVNLIKTVYQEIPLLGICLGHQAIGAAFGSEIIRAKKLMHGKSSMILHDGKTVFKGIENPFSAMRYHSLVINKKQISPDLIVSATSKDDHEIMAVRHKKYLVQGIQFHPESILTKSGMDILRNFLKLCK
jgi:anthranilate synthase/aminodeoxychorismate synthase-like glutamine amidotransferase